MLYEALFRNRTYENMLIYWMIFKPEVPIGNSDSRGFSGELGYKFLNSDDTTNTYKQLRSNFHVFNLKNSELQYKLSSQNHLRDEFPKADG